MKICIELEKKSNGRTAYLATLKNDAGETLGVGRGNARLLALGDLLERCAPALSIEISGPAPDEYERTGLFSNHNSP